MNTDSQPFDSTSSKVVVPIKFLNWQPLYEVEKPFQIFINIPEHVEDKRTTNLVFEDVKVEVHDVRKIATTFSLNEHGFAYRRCEIPATNFESRTAVEQEYLPEVESILRQELDGVDKIFIFDWRLRKNAPEIEGSVIDLNDLSSWLRPALHVHVGLFVTRISAAYAAADEPQDQSPAAVLNRILLQLPDEANDLLRGRIRVVNVWKPLNDCVVDWPLAICDGSTVQLSDLVEADHVRRHYTGSTMYLKHSSRQKFYYMSNQTKNDVLLFKNFDSDRTRRSTFAPHASFLNSSIPETYDPRQSIEVRALVFTRPHGDGMTGD